MFILYQSGIRGVKRKKGGVPNLRPGYGLLLFAFSFCKASALSLSAANAAIPPLIAILLLRPSAIRQPVLATSGFRPALPARAPLLICVIPGTCIDSVSDQPYML